MHAFQIGNTPKHHPPATGQRGTIILISSVITLRAHRIKRAVRREAHHHGVHNAQRRSIPCHGAGEERGHQQDDQRYHIAEDPRRDAVNEALPRGA